MKQSIISAIIVFLVLAVPSLALANMGVRPAEISLPDYINAILLIPIIAAFLLIWRNRRKS